MYVLVVYICISYSLNYNLMRQLHCVQTEVKLPLSMQQSSVSVWVKTQVTRNISEGKLERKHIPNLPRVLYGVRCIRYQGCTHAQVWQSLRQVWFGSKDQWFFAICNHPYLDGFFIISNNHPILDDFGSFVSKSCMVLCMVYAATSQDAEDGEFQSCWFCAARLVFEINRLRSICGSPVQKWKFSDV